MIQLQRKEECCGCSACYSVCPKSCITMSQDSEGFLYPHINKQACIGCGLCNQTCPIINYYSQELNKPETYVAYCKENDVRRSSSSGGIFSLIAEEVLDREGIVFGAAFDKDMMVHHIGITKKSEIARLRGSKYLQSRVEQTYADTQKALQTKQTVLYSGTGCQIAGLKRYLLKPYDNLITVDVLCHGTPTPKLWKKYLTWREGITGSYTRDVSFRNKDLGWKNSSLKITFENNEEYKELGYNDYYIQLFLSDICLRPSCHECKFKSVNHPSDITLGDCWGVESYMPEMDDNQGTSVILVHTAKGKKLINSVDHRLCKKEADLDRALPPDADSRKSVRIHTKRAEFFSKIDRMPMEKLIKLIRSPFRKRLVKLIKEKLNW